MIPGANTTTFSGPRKSAFGGTSDATIAEVRPRPPSPEYRSGISSQELFLDVRSTRSIFAIEIPRLRKYSHYDNSSRAPVSEENRDENQNCSLNITLPTVRSTVTVRRTGSQV
jgi:hypothetical protein